MPPTRHQRNNTANSVYTYHERMKDAKVSGWGSLEERLSKHAVKDFDCCSLTLQPCRDPLVSPDGHLFDREAIQEYIVHHKRENIRKLKEWEKQQNKESQELADLARAEQETKVKRFVEEAATPTVNRNVEDEALAAASSVSNMAGSKKRELPSFWVPAMRGKEAKATLMDKPDQKIYCPITGKPLKMKELMPVKFTKSPDEEDFSKKTGASGSHQGDFAKKHRYICAVTKDLLTNSTPCAVLRPSGDVVTMDCVERIIKKDWTHPLSGEKLTDADVIPLQRGGTGYAATNQQLKAKLARPVLELQ